MKEDTYFIFHIYKSRKTKKYSFYLKTINGAYLADSAKNYDSFEEARDAILYAQQLSSIHDNYIIILGIETYSFRLQSDIYTDILVSVLIESRSLAEYHCSTVHGFLKYAQVPEKELINKTPFFNTWREIIRLLFYRTKS